MAVQTKLVMTSLLAAAALTAAVAVTSAIGQDKPASVEKLAAAADQAPKIEYTKSKSQDRARKEKKYYYLTPGDVELAKVVAPPPRPGSPQERRDIADVYVAQANRTESNLKKAILDDRLSHYLYADVLGPKFQIGNVPITNELLERVTTDARLITDEMKAIWDRPRPFNANKGITPESGTPRTNVAYPSGTTMFGHTSAVMLANMVPEKAAEIYERAAESSYYRVLLGHHYPADTEASRIAAALIASALFKKPAFMAEFEKAKAELRQVLGLSDKPMLVSQQPAGSGITPGGVSAGGPVDKK